MFTQCPSCSILGMDSVVQVTSATASVAQESTSDRRRTVVGKSVVVDMAVVLGLGE